MDDLVCEWCDAPFSRPSDMGPSPKFCSASHRQRAYEVRRIEGLVSDLTAERDRLRAVVDAARDYVAARDAAGLDLPPGLTGALAQLDVVSGVESPSWIGLCTALLVSTGEVCNLRHGHEGPHRYPSGGDQLDVSGEATDG